MTVDVQLRIGDIIYDEPGWEITALTLPRIGEYLYYGGPNENDDGEGIKPYEEEWCCRVTAVTHHVRLAAETGAERSFLPFIIVTAEYVCMHCYAPEHDYADCPKKETT